MGKIQEPIPDILYPRFEAKNAPLPRKFSNFLCHVTTPQMGSAEHHFCGLISRAAAAALVSPGIVNPWKFTPASDKIDHGRVRTYLIPFFHSPLSTLAVCFVLFVFFRFQLSKYIYNAETSIRLPWNRQQNGFGNSTEVTLCLSCSATHN